MNSFAVDSVTASQKYDLKDKQKNPEARTVILFL